MKSMKAEARKKMLQKLKKEMKKDKHDKSGMMDKMKDMKKVTVASDSSEGLMKGMDVAKKIMKKKAESDDGDDYECGGSKYEDGGTKEESIADKIKKKRKK